jgi:hypothetical protein
MNLGRYVRVKGNVYERKRLPTIAIKEIKRRLERESGGRRVSA